MYQVLDTRVVDKLRNQNVSFLILHKTEIPHIKHESDPF